MRRVLRSLLFLTACWLLCGSSESFARHRRCYCYSYGSYGSSGGSSANYSNGYSQGYASQNYANATPQRNYYAPQKNYVAPQKTYQAPQKNHYSYASYGSTGGSPIYQKPAAPAQRIIAKPAQPQVYKATLELTLPEAAQVFLVNQRMSLTGTTRRFMVPVTDANKSYQYPIRIEMTSNGQKTAAATTVQIRAGMVVRINVLGDGKTPVSTVSQL